MKKMIFGIWLSLTTLMGLSQPAGGLDANFGTGGKVVTSFSNLGEEAKAVILQSDGKIVIAGYINFAATGKDFFAARYLEDGTLDNTFGNNGFTAIDVQLGSDDIAHSVVMDNNGGFILAGNSDDGINRNAAIVKLTADGLLDETFGNAGRVITDLVTNQQDEIKVVKHHALTGKIIIGGQSASTSSIAQPIIARFLSNGDLDTTFNGTGILSATVTSGDLQRTIMVEDLEVSPNGKISAVGWRKYISTSISSEFWACRVLSNGTMDNTFSTDGAVAYAEVGGSCYGYAMELTANQDIILVGTRSYLGSNDFRILTIASGGTIANSSSNYYVSSDIDIAYAMAIDMDGKYILSGSAGTANAKSFGTLRALTPGDLQADYSFNNNGRVMTSFNGNTFNECWDVVVQNDNKIVCVGYTGNDIAICRYIGDAQPQLDIFNLATPANNSVNQNYASMDLSWTEAFGAVLYEVEVATDINFSNIAATGQVTTLGGTLTNLQPATAYWWRVRASDGVNWGAFVGPWKFTTLSLNAFNLTTPANNANNVAYNVVNFNWTDNAGASGYHFMLDTDINFNNAPFTYFPSASAQSANNLTPGTTYYWKVRATNDGANYGNWVGPWTFNTQAAPVGVSELSTQSMVAYPNPCSDYFELKVNNENIGQMAMIFNSNGQLIKTIMLTGNTTRINTEDLASGIYTVRVGDIGAKAGQFPVKVQVVKQ